MGGQDRPAVTDRPHNNQRAAPPTLWVPQKVLVLLSGAFYPTESRLISHRGLSKGVRPALCFACWPYGEGARRPLRMARPVRKR